MGLNDRTRRIIVSSPGKLLVSIVLRKWRSFSFTSTNQHTIWEKCLMTIYNCLPRTALGQKQLDTSKRRRNLDAYNTILRRHFQTTGTLMLTAVNWQFFKSSTRGQIVFQIRIDTLRHVVAHEPLSHTLECKGKLNLLKAQFCAFNTSNSTTILLTVENWQITP